MLIRYGTNEFNIDVTEICYHKLITQQNIIKIPSGDCERAQHFTDPIHGTLKKIFIILDNNSTIEFEYNVIIHINSLTNEIMTPNAHDLISWLHNGLHKQLQLQYGSFQDEMPEQEMVVRYLNGFEKVLEI
jgi:hypothetical protein